MSAIRCVTIICDGCGKDALETNHFQFRAARKQAMKHGWVVGGGPALTTGELKDYCPACADIMAAKLRRKTK